MRPAVAAVLAGLAAPVGAGEVGLEACLADTDRPADCIGSLAGSCMAARPDGESTLGMVECIGVETAAWDGLLNATYRAVMESARDADATGDVLSEEHTRVATLRDAQRAWIAFRDADCLAQAARWGLGSLGQVSAANCLLSMTAERTIHLRGLLEP